MAIKLTHGKNEYILTYNRASVKIMERKGFDVTTMGSKILTQTEQIFNGAFIANHGDLKVSEIEEIFVSVKDKNGLIGKLGEMLNETYSSLMEDPEKNGSTWEEV